MDLYSSSSSDHVFHIDDLLDFSNEQIFSSDSLPAPPLDVSVSSSALPQVSSVYSSASHEFVHELYLPSDDVAELEWLSRFTDDSFADDIPTNTPDVVFSGNPKVTVSRLAAPSRPGSYVGDLDCLSRRCTHCASEKTPQWRTGPMGPKTLCNACGVRYKSGRLVPEYRPAASPTFVLTQHSNSHRKVMELRRQKEFSQRQTEQMYGRRRSQQHDFEVC